MSNIYDVFNERKSSVSMISEGFDYNYFDPESIEEFDTIEEGIDVLTDLQKEMQDSNIRLCAESLVSDLLSAERDLKFLRDIIHNNSTINLLVSKYSFSNCCCASLLLVNTIGSSSTST